MSISLKKNGKKRNIKKSTEPFIQQKKLYPDHIDFSNSESLLDLDYTDSSVLDLIHSHFKLFITSDDLASLKELDVTMIGKYSIAYKCYRIAQAKYKQLAFQLEMKSKIEARTLMLSSQQKIGAQKADILGRAAAMEAYGDELLEWEIKYRFWQSILEEMDKVAKRIDSIAMITGIETKIWRAGIPETFTATAGGENETFTATVGGENGEENL